MRRLVDGLQRSKQAVLHDPSTNRSKLGTAIVQPPSAWETLSTASLSIPSPKCVYLSVVSGSR